MNLSTYLSTHIDACKQAELTIDIARTLNQDFIESGELLFEWINAYVAQRINLAGYYDDVFKSRQAEAQLQQPNSLTANLSPWLFRSGNKF